MLNPVLIHQNRPLTAVIMHEDVTAALKRLKRRKAAVVDGIRAEFIFDAV